MSVMSITTSSGGATAKVSSKGWIVIPAPLRHKYRIEPGAEVRIVDYGGVLGLVPALRDPVREARGSFSSKGIKRTLTRALLAERRRDRDRESG